MGSDGMLNRRRFLQGSAAAGAAAGLKLGSSPTKAQEHIANIEAPKDLAATVRRIHQDVLSGKKEETAAQAVQYRNDDFTIALTEGDHDTVTPDTEKGPFTQIRDPELVESALQIHGHPSGPEAIAAMTGIVVASDAPEVSRTLSSASHQDLLHLRLSTNSIHLGDRALLVEGVVDPGGLWLYRGASLLDLRTTPAGSAALDRYLESNQKLHTTIKERVLRLDQSAVVKFFGDSRRMFETLRDQARKETFPINRDRLDLRTHWYPGKVGDIKAISAFMIHEQLLSAIHRGNREQLAEIGYTDSEIDELSAHLKTMRAVTTVADSQLWQDERKKLMRATVTNADVAQAIGSAKEQALLRHGTRMEFLPPERFDEVRATIAELVKSAREGEAFRKANGIF